MDAPRPITSPVLRRIRLAESPDERGEKKVWHSNGNGVDLVTHVDSNGLATFHELTFGRGTSVDWARDRGVRTGTEELVDPKPGRAAHARFTYHQPPSREVLVAGVAAIGAPGDDRYLQHLVQVCRNALDALDASGYDKVTTGPRPDLPPVAPPRAPTWIGRVKRLFRL